MTYEVNFHLEVRDADGKLISDLTYGFVKTMNDEQIKRVQVLKELAKLGFESEAA